MSRIPVPPRFTLILLLVLAAAGPTAGPGQVDTDMVSLRLNIPAYRLDVLAGGRVVGSYIVAVGTPDHRTPRGAFEVTRVVWNPWWFPPPFDWAKDMVPTPPCETNPTGRVKLFFGRYLYIHGTPDETSLGSAASHGCVRLSNSDAIALARTVHRHASPDVRPATLDSLESRPRQTRTIHLARPVPLEVRYERVEIRAGRVEIHPDVYGLEPLSRDRVAELLRASGVAGTLEPSKLDALIEEGARVSASAPISLLIRTTPPD